MEVEIHPITYEIEVKGIWAVFDIGQSIDEKIIKGQIDGGIIQGLGFATMEVLGIQDGKVIHNSFSKYTIPSFLDAPKIYSKLISNSYKYGPFGAKGVGELTLIGVAPALASAVENALGIQINQIPIKPEKLRELMIREPSTNSI